MKKVVIEFRGLNEDQAKYIVDILGKQMKALAGGMALGCVDTRIEEE